MHFRFTVPASLAALPLATHDTLGSSWSRKIVEMGASSASARKPWGGHKQGIPASRRNYHAQWAACHLGSSGRGVGTDCATVSRRGALAHTPAQLLCLKPIRSRRWWVARCSNNGRLFNTADSAVTRLRPLQPEKEKILRKQPAEALEQFVAAVSAAAGWRRCSCTRQG